MSSGTAADSLVHRSAPVSDPPVATEPMKPKRSVLRHIIPANAWGDIELGILAALLCMVGSWYVSPWLDESATAHIIRYPLNDMQDLFSWIDQVYAPYYYFMHWWVSVFGTTPFTLRLPSVLAVGIGTSAMATSGRIFAQGRGQLPYAVCFALLPRIMAMAIEARPYALAAMFVALGLMFVALIKKRATVLRILGLSLAMALAVYAQMYAVLPIIGLTIVGFIIVKGWRRWFVVMAAFIAGAACLPFGLSCLPQFGQVQWITTVKHDWWDHALIESWAASRTNVNMASYDKAPHTVALVLAGLAVALLLFALISACSRKAEGLTARRQGTGRLFLALIPIILTAAVLWVGSITAGDFLLARYFTAAGPFYAMLLAEAIMLLRWKWMRIVPLLMLVCALTLFVFQRRPYAKVTWEDYTLAIQVIKTQAQPGDGLLMEPIPWMPNENFYAAIPCDPETFSKVVNIAQPERPKLDAVFQLDPPVADLAEQPSLPKRIWLGSKPGEKNVDYEKQLWGLGYQPQWEKLGPSRGHKMALWVR